jgi:hypothetical protein
MVPGQSRGIDAVSLNTIPEYVDKPDIEDQQYLPEIIRPRLPDAERTAMVSRANLAKANVPEKAGRSGMAKDLPADLNGWTHPGRAVHNVIHDAGP